MKERREKEREKEESDADASVPDRPPKSAEQFEPDPSHQALALVSEPDVEALSPTQAFEAFWAVYPKRVGRKAADIKFRAILKRGEATAEQLIHGAKAYADSPRVASGWIKDPTTWLNGGHWADEPEPPRPEARHTGGGQQREWSGLAMALNYDRDEP